MVRIVTAAVIMIGDELLSGRTQDSNLKTIAQFLNPLGVEVREARVIPDVHETIIATVRTMAERHNYVFTTGGIGPTHDDITADAVAEAFGRRIGVREDARKILEDWYAGRGQEMNQGRLRMARIPDGAELVLNPVSAAPGFRIANVFVMAGVPSVMRGMLEDIGHRLEGGAVVHAHTVRAAGVREGDIAGPLAELAKARPDVNFGSYPFMRPKGSKVEFGVSLVARSRDQDMVAASVTALEEIIRAQGGEPEVDPDKD